MGSLFAVSVPTGKSATDAAHLGRSVKRANSEVYWRKEQRSACHKETLRKVFEATSNYRVQASQVKALVLESPPVGQGLSNGVYCLPFKHWTDYCCFVLHVCRPGEIMRVLCRADASTGPLAAYNSLALQHYTQAISYLHSIPLAGAQCIQCII